MKELKNQTIPDHVGTVTGVNPDLFSEIYEIIKTGRVNEARNLVKNIHPADLADLLQGLALEKRENLFDLIRQDLNPDMLTELNEAVREHITDRLSLQEMADAVAEMETDDAVDVVEELDSKNLREILKALPIGERTLIEEALSYPEDSAGRLMQRGVVAVPTHWTVGQAIDFMREEEGLPKDFFDIFLVDPAHKPRGSIPLSRVLRTKRNVALNAIMHADMKIIPGVLDQEEVAFVFRKRDLISAPVVDDDGRLIGVITVDDIVDVIHEEHEEDIMRLGGVGEEADLYDAVIATTRSRFSWLLIHLFAAILAAYVISFFAGTIEEMVALAVLMPIVATMGGTASVQALTVAVRAIAMKELTMPNAIRAIGKEAIVGLLNGLIFALLIGALAWAWFGSPTLGGVLGLAVIINLTVAGLSGSALPVLLQRLGFDPAVASSAFLTSITDVVGFYVFLGLAAVLLL